LHLGTDKAAFLILIDTIIIPCTTAAIWVCPTDRCDTLVTVSIERYSSNAWVMVTFDCAGDLADRFSLYNTCDIPPIVTAKWIYSANGSNARITGGIKCLARYAEVVGTFYYAVGGATTRALLAFIASHITAVSRAEVAGLLNVITAVAYRQACAVASATARG
jgi:hypothetical protein